MDWFVNKGYCINYNNGVLEIKTPENKQFSLRDKSSDWSVFLQIYYYREYYPLVELIKWHRHKPQIIVDAGSNIGLTTIFLHDFFPEATFYCIEPDTANCCILEKNIKRNNINANIYNLALWDKNDVVSISNEFRDGQSWSLQTVKRNEKLKSVKTITLNEIIESNKLQGIDILKIDIEGSESVVFQDEKIHEILIRCKFIIIEIHVEVCDKEMILSRLKRANFEIFSCGEHTLCYNKNLVND